MKGLTLAADTVIVVIIASVVLIVVLAFFKGSGNRGMNQVDAYQERTRLCNIYVRMDMNCDGKADADGTSIAQAQKAVLNICDSIGGYSSCPSNAVKCVQECCGFLCSK